MKVSRVFLDIDMRQSHDGLRAVAKKAGTPLEKRKLFFMNRKATHFKMLVDNRYVVHYRSEHGRIPLDAISFLPESFGGSKLEMDQAIEKSLKKKLRIQDTV